MKSFQSYLRIERGLSANTIANYTFDLQRLTSYLEANNILATPQTITDDAIQQFVFYLSKHVNPRSQSRVISGLKSFFSYL
ncbi:MAG: site-specific integrase, partial [Flavobacterium sp.]|nr:site-specific integrase [Flavobacterium sp.]